MSISRGDDRGLGSIHLQVKSYAHMQMTHTIQSGRGEECDIQVNGARGWVLLILNYARKKNNHRKRADKIS